MGNGRHLLVVGIDGPQGCRAAAIWAEQEAWRRKLDLRLVHVLEWPLHLKPAIWEGLRDLAQTLDEPRYSGSSVAESACIRPRRSRGWCGWSTGQDQPSGGVSEGDVVLDCQEQRVECAQLPHRCASSVVSALLPYR
jgi:hypothetical protein